MAARIFYIDDSGAESTGYIVYGWIDVGLEHWSAALRCWLDFRKKLYRGTPASPRTTSYTQRSSSLGAVARRPGRSGIGRSGCADV
ncbi:hypothetical protein GCM10010376_92440 [Streptomyces violaceusniger]